MLAFEKAKPTPTSAATSGRTTRRRVNLSHAPSIVLAAPGIRCQAHNRAIYARIFTAIDTKARHPAEFDRNDWVSDRLPSRSETIRLGIAADVVFLGTVWMHFRQEDRLKAFRKLCSLTRSGGLIAMSVRRGPDDAERGIAEATVEETERLARGHGLAVCRRPQRRPARQVNCRNSLAVWKYAVCKGVVVGNVTV